MSREGYTALINGQNPVSLSDQQMIDAIRYIKEEIMKDPDYIRLAELAGCSEKIASTVLPIISTTAGFIIFDEKEQKSYYLGSNSNLRKKIKKIFKFRPPKTPKTTEVKKSAGERVEEDLQKRREGLAQSRPILGQAAEANPLGVPPGANLPTRDPNSLGGNRGNPHPPGDGTGISPSRLQPSEESDDAEFFKERGLLGLHSAIKDSRLPTTTAPSSNSRDIRRRPLDMSSSSNTPESSLDRSGFSQREIKFLVEQFRIILENQKKLVEQRLEENQEKSEKFEEDVIQTFRQINHQLNELNDKLKNLENSHAPDSLESLKNEIYYRLQLEEASFLETLNENTRRAFDHLDKKLEELKAQNLIISSALDKQNQAQSKFAPKVKMD